MAFLRSLIFSIGSVIALILVSAFSVFTLPFSFETRYRMVTQWARFTLWWFRVTCGVRYEVRGLENVPESTCIIFSKHQSTWETLFIQRFFPPQAWLLKKELLSVPMFGWALRLAEPIAIDRNAGRKAIKQLLEQGKRRLQLGRWVVVFPEGTRMTPGKKGKYGAGGAMLAQSTGYPVLPIAHNAGTVWPKKGFLKRPGTIVFSIGPLIDTQSKKAGEINREAEAWIESEMTRIGDRAD